MNKDPRQTAVQEPDYDEPDFGELLTGILRTLRQRKWFILIPFAAITVAATQMSLRVPNQYRSEAVIGVTPQQVSQRFVEGDLAPLDEAVNALQQEILARPSLTNIIREMNLYADPDWLMEDRIAQMQEDMKVSALESRRDQITSIEVSYLAESPVTAQRVTARLANAFIQENAKQSEVRVQSNNAFLDEEVRIAAGKLAAQEARLEAYKTRNLEQLPELQTTNSMALTDLRSRLRGIQPEIDRLRRSLRFIQNQVSDKLGSLQAERAELMRRYTAAMPVVVKKDAEIALYSALQELFSANGPSTQARQILAGSSDAQAAQIRNQAEDATNDIEKLQHDQAEIEAQIKDYSSRVSAAPLREQEQAAIARDIKLLRDNYEALKQKQLAAGLTMNLSERDGTQRFRLVEEASLPARPSAPNRLKWALGGAAGGLVLGIALAFLRGSVVTTFASEKEVASAFSVPLVLGIPEILTPREQSGRTWKAVLDWVGALALLACVVSSEVYIFLRG